MARVNPVGLPKVKERRESKTFIDPEQEEPLPLTFRRRHLLELSEWLEEAEEWAKNFADGIPVDGESMVVPMSQWQTIATLCAMQCPDEGDAAYTQIEWVYLMLRYPNAWPEIVTLALKVQGLGADQGNSPKDGSKSSTPPSSRSTDSTTTSPNISSPPCGASTSESLDVAA